MTFKELTQTPVAHFLAGIGTGVTGIPNQILNLAEFANLPVNKIVSPETRKYIEELGTAPDTRAGKTGAILGEIGQTFLLPASKAKHAGTIAKYGVPVIKEGVTAYLQELSKSKDPYRATWAAGIAGTLGGIATKVSSQISKAASQHPYDATLASAATARWWMSEAIKASRSDAGKALQPDAVERLIDVAIKFQEPFTVAGSKNLDKYYRMTLDKMEDSIHLTQNYADDLAKIPGAPPSIKTPATPLRFLQEEIDQLKKAHSFDEDRINKFVQEFAKKEPSIASLKATLTSVSKARSRFAEFVSGHVGTREAAQATDPMRTLVGKAFYNAAKRSETHGMQAVRQAGENFSQGTHLADLKPWNITLDVKGTPITGMYDDIARIASDLKELKNIAEVGSSKQTTGIRQAMRVLATALPLPAMADPAVASKTAHAIEKTGIGGKPLAEGLMKSRPGAKAATIVESVTRKPPVEESGRPSYNIENSMFTDEPETESESSKGAEDTRTNLEVLLDSNNPVALRPSQGEIFNGEIEGGERGYAKFDSPASGVRAAVITLQTYQKKYGLNTLREMLHRYAPMKDGNDPDAYAKTVSEKAGIPPDQPINTSDINVMRKIIRAMAGVEIVEGNAKKYEDDINAGVDKAFNRTTTPPR